MFGTEIHITTFCFIVLQTLIFIPSWVNWIAKPKENFRLRYAIINFLFLAYNVASGLIPDEKLGIDRIPQDIISYTIGITCVTFFLYYVYKEFGVKPLRVLSISIILRILVLDFILLFILPYTITEDLNLSRNIFLIVPAALAIGALINTYYHLYKDFTGNKSRYYKLRILAGAISMLSIISLPLTIIILGDNQPVEHTLFNIGFVTSSIAHVLRINYLTRIDVEIRNEDLFKNVTDLSYKDKEILYLVMNNPEKSFEELSKEYLLDQKKVSALTNRLYKVLNLISGNGTNAHIKYTVIQKFEQFNFSEREKAVAELILKGNSYKDIGAVLFIAEGTVSKHASNIFKKSKAQNRKDFITIFN